MFDDIRRWDIRVDMGTQTDSISTTAHTRISDISFSISTQPHPFALAL